MTPTESRAVLTPAECRGALTTAESRVVLELEGPARDLHTTTPHTRRDMHTYNKAVRIWPSLTRRFPSKIQLFL